MIEKTEEWIKAERIWKIKEIGRENNRINR